MPRKRDPNKRYHDRIAGKYEEIYDDIYWQWHDALTWDYLKKHLPRDLSTPAIDLGCGSGKWGRRVLKSGFHVTFSDLSHKMVDAARKQVEFENGLEKASFVQADLMDLSQLPQQHFGIAMAMGEPLCCTPDPKRALRQIADILRPDGVLVATFDNKVACVDHYLEQSDLDALERFLKTGRTQWLTRKAEEQFELITSTPGEIGKWLDRAGFEVIEMVGKTVLPIRRHRDMLNDPGRRRRLSRLEQQLAREPSNLGRCAHLQVTARRVGG